VLIIFRLSFSFRSRKDVKAVEIYLPNKMPRTRESRFREEQMRAHERDRAEDREILAERRARKERNKEVRQRWMKDISEMQDRLVWLLTDIQMTHSQESEDEYAAEREKEGHPTPAGERLYQMLGGDGAGPIEDPILQPDPESPDQEAEEESDQEADQEPEEEPQDYDIFDKISGELTVKQEKYDTIFSLSIRVSELLKQDVLLEKFMEEASPVLQMIMDSFIKAKNPSASK